MKVHELLKTGANTLGNATIQITVDYPYGYVSSAENVLTLKSAPAKSRLSNKDDLYFGATVDYWYIKDNVMKIYANNKKRAGEMIIDTFRY